MQFRFILLFPYLLCAPQLYAVTALFILKHMQTQSRPIISHQHHARLHLSNSSASDQHSAIACAVTLAFYSVSLSRWMIIRVMTGWCFSPPFHTHTHARTHTHTQSAVNQATCYCLFRTNINFLFLQICRQDCVLCTVGVGPVALFLSLLTSLTLSLFYSRILAGTVCFPSDRQPHADIHKLFGSSV